jgi:hypothetical protein
MIGFNFKIYENKLNNKKKNLFKLNFQSARFYWFGLLT